MGQVRWMKAISLSAGREGPLGVGLEKTGGTEWRARTTMLLRSCAAKVSFWKKRDDSWQGKSGKKIIFVLSYEMEEITIHLLADGNNPVNHCETGHWLRIRWGGGVGWLTREQNVWNSHLKVCESEGSVGMKGDCQLAFRARLKFIAESCENYTS